MKNRPILSVSSTRRINKDDAPEKSFGKKPVSNQKPNHRRQLEQHEAALVPHIRNRNGIDLFLLDGTALYGVTPIGFDRYSIAIEYEGCRETVFKSAIARIVTPVEA